MVTVPNKHSPRTLQDEVTAAIAALPGVQVVSTKEAARVDGKEIDLLIDAQVKGSPVSIAVEVKASGYPRDVQMAAWQLAPIRHLGGPALLVPLIAAPALSATSRELLRRQGIGYWDAGGSLYLELPWALYWIDRPAPAPRPRRLRTIFRGSAAQVVHALLLEPKRQWHVQDLATRAEAAPSTVHQVFTFLEEQLWAEKQGKGPKAVRVVRDPGALVDAWAEVHSLATYTPHRFHRWTQQPAELLRSATGALDQLGIEYALTLASGAQLVAPFSTQVPRLSLLVPASAEPDHVAELADLRRVDEGETITFLATHERWPLLFRRRLGGSWVASDVQLYLDLWAWPQRGKEQARHLRAERLGY